MKAVKYPIPRISDLLNSLGNSRIISSLDLASAYHQTEIREEDREKTAFTVRQTKYEFRRVPFGLTSAPGYFSRVISETLIGLVGFEILAYLDDILVFAKTKEEHLQRLEEVLSRLAKANLKLKIQKCKFFTDEVSFLGYKVTTNGMKMDEQRIEAIKNMPYPKNKKEVMSILGTYNYFRGFVRGFADIADPLYELLRKNVRFVWEKRHSEAVDRLKEKLCSAPVLKYPDFKREFTITTDASQVGIGACLMQLHEGRLHPIAYVSKCLSQTQREYSVTKRETLALIFALEQFRHLILSYTVHVYTDHEPLVGILNKDTKDAAIRRWVLLIQEYQIKLHYVRGKDNVVADVLSRLTNVKETAEGIPDDLDEKLISRVNVIDEELTSYIPEKVSWSEDDLRKEQKADKNCVALIKALKTATSKSSKMLKCRVIRGILFVLRTVKRGNLNDEFLVPYVRNRLMVPAFKLIHEETTAGHRGYERTLKLFRRNFYNSDEAVKIKHLCDKCESCIKAKATPENVPLEKYPIPKRPFHTISMDILGPLRITSSNKRFIAVLRDFTTRYSILFALENKETDSIINVLRNVIANFGSSTNLITDNALELKSEKLKNFLQFFNTKKIEIAPYHPSSQGLAERINREINKMLRIYCNEMSIVNWDELLPVIQLTINNTHNASLGETPFFVLYGYDSPTVTLSPPKMNYSESDLNYHLKRVTSIRDHCRNQLIESQAKYTDYHNMGKVKKNIEVGQRVYAKMSKFKSLSKLDYRVEGPFTVVGTKGKAFKLKDLTNRTEYTVHPDFICVPKVRVVDPIVGEEKVKKNKTNNLQPRKQKRVGKKLG